MLSDDKLAAMAEATFWAHDDGDQDDAAAGNWLAVARAVRAALTEDVAPLAPGETVTIRAVYGAAELRDSYGCLLLELPADPSQNVIAARRVLDAAVVRQIIEALDHEIGRVQRLAQSAPDDPDIQRLWTDLADCRHTAHQLARKEAANRAARDGRAA